MRGRWIVMATAAAMSLVGAGAAQADVTLGSAAMPSGATPHTCPTGFVVVQASSDPATPYAVPSVPAEPGLLTSWQTNTTGATPGAPITLVVLKPTSSTTYSVVGADAEALPNPLPASNVATFTPATPLAVTSGDALGVYNAASGAVCYWSGGTTPSADTLAGLPEPATPAAGQTLTVSGGTSPAGYTLNVAATVKYEQDVGVTASATPASVPAGNFAVVSSSVTNSGPEATPITFTDTIPSGLAIESVAAGSGSCTTAGQQVTCTISGLAVGQSAPVNVVVDPTAPGTYTNTVTAAPAAGIADPNSANNTASTSLVVTAALGPPPKCTIPSLARTPLTVARSILILLGCRTGRVQQIFSASVAKGAVIKTTPRPGTYTLGTTVSLQVSKGRKPHPKRKKHKHKHKH
jgi:hypothetical protein